MFFQQYYKIIEGEETILFLLCIEYTLKKRNAKQIARVFFFFLLCEYMYSCTLYVQYVVWFPDCFSIRTAMHTKQGGCVMNMLCALSYTYSSNY